MRGEICLTLHNSLKHLPFQFWRESIIFKENHKPLTFKSHFLLFPLPSYVEEEASALNGSPCTFQMFTAPISAILRKKMRKQTNIRPISSVYRELWREEKWIHTVLCLEKAHMNTFRKLIHILGMSYANSWQGSLDHVMSLELYEIAIILSCFMIRKFS